MSMPNAAQWGVTFKPNPTATMRLFCFSYAGGGASAFAKWPQKLPRHVELLAVQLPGRESRFSEPALTDMSLVMKGLLDLIEYKRDMPFTFFGHSLGALLAFELTRELIKRHLPQPRHLFVSGKRAPAMPSRKKPIYNLPDDDLIEELGKYNGTPKVVLENKELMPLVLPRLRADTALFDCYRYVQCDPLPCSITAFGGDNDPYVNLEELSGWEAETQSEFRYCVFPGDHFFIHEKEAEVLQVLSEILNTIPNERQVLPIFA